MNIKQIIKTFSSYLVLTICWTYLIIIFDDFTTDDKGLVTSLGYLIIFSFAIFIGQKPLKKTKLFILTIGIISIFVSMFFFLILFLLLTKSYQFEILVLIVISIVTSFLLTLLLHKLYVIQNKVYILFFTFLSLLFAHFLFYKKLDIGFSILPRSQTFIIYNTIILIPLSFGLSKKSG